MARLRAAGCVFAEAEAELLRSVARSPRHLARLVDRRVSGLPLEHVVGWADFAGIRVPVDPGVFVPRPRSQWLVETVVAELHAGERLLDLCCGSGAIGAAVAGRVPVEVFACDIDRRAVSNARRTLRRAGVRGRVRRGDLFAAVPARYRQSFAAIAVVAPYVPSGSIELLPHEARDYEPRRALDGGADGLSVLRRIVVQADAWLVPGGVLVTEIAEEQESAAIEMMESAGFGTHIRADDGAVVAVGRRQKVT